MPRNFTVASASRITTSALGGQVRSGILAAIIKCSSDTGLNRQVMSVRTSGTVVQMGLRIDTINFITGYIDDTAYGAPTLSVIAADGWVFIAFSKETGTKTPRFHKYVYSTNTWTHENFGTTVADGASSTPGSGRIGPKNSDSVFEGDIAIAGAFSSTLSGLSSAQIDESIAGLPFNLLSWINLSPTALWLLDQDSVSQNVVDMTGGGANQSSRNATTVSTSSLPSFSYGINPLYVTKSTSTIHLAAVDSSGNAIVTIEGIRLVFGALSPSGAAVVTFAGIRGVEAAFSLSGLCTVSYNGAVGIGGQIVSTGNAIVTLSGILGAVGSFNPTGNVIVTFNGVGVFSSGFNPTGNTSVTFIGTPIKIGSMVSSGDSTVTFNGNRLLIAGVNSLGQSVVTINGTRIVIGSVVSSGNTIVIFDAGQLLTGQIISVGNSLVLINAVAWRLVAYDEFPDTERFALKVDYDNKSSQYTLNDEINTERLSLGVEYERRPSGLYILSDDSSPSQFILKVEQ